MSDKIRPIEPIFPSAPISPESRNRPRTKHDFQEMIQKKMEERLRKAKKLKPKKKKK